MMFAAGSPELSGTPNQIYAHGISRFLEAVNLPQGHRHVVRADGVCHVRL